MSEDEKYEQLRQVCVSYRNDCENKDKQIDQLKQQLAEKDLRIEELESQFAYECECNKQFVECQNENEQLKQQLTEKEEQLNATNRAYWELVEKSDDKYLNFEILLGEKIKLEQQLAEKEKEAEDDEITRHMMCGDYTWCEMVTKLMKEVAEKDNTITALIEDSKASKELLKKEIKQLQKDFEEEYNDGFIWEGNARDAWDKIEELKKELAEKEQSIGMLNQHLTDKTIEIERLSEEIEEVNREFVQSTHDWKEIVDEKIKAKTEFAIEKLQRVKDSVLDVSNGYWRYFMKNGQEYMMPNDLEGCLNETIDTIIKELEGER